MNKAPVAIIGFIFIASNSLFAYDKTIKDNYGRTTGYLNKKGDKIYKVDKYGRYGNSVDSKGRIKDKYGRTTGYLKWDEDRIYYTNTKGRRSGDYIESDGTIKDKYGRKKGTIK